MKTQLSSAPVHELDCDLLAVGLSEDLSQLDALDAHFDGHLSALARERKLKGTDASATLRIPTLGRLAASELLLVGIGDGSPERLRAAAARVGREARLARAKRVGLSLGSELDVPAAVEAVQAGNYAWERYKPEAARTPSIEELLVVGAEGSSVDHAEVRARWQSWARDLINLPAAELTPEGLADRARELDQIPGVEVEIWDLERCRAEQCVGIVAVGQGSSHAGCLIHVRYQPEEAKARVALVGKGVTYDAGGLSLKPTAGMVTMRCDMGGGATALATTAAVAEQGLPIAVDCFVGAVENMLGGGAYKNGDILRYPNGVSVEIHNTDAEGRLVLADCLIKACEVPDVAYVLDMATLTGACVVAVGNDFTGLFTDDDELACALHAAADANDEGLWRLPLHKPYAKMLDSDFAQIKNIGGKWAGASTAALFLQHFVTDEVRWAHLDIAGSAFSEKPHRHYAAGATGEMVRSLATWMERL